MVSISKITNRKSGQDLLSHQMARLKMGIVKIAWGASENYATGGIDISGALNELGISTVLGVFPAGGTLVGWIPVLNSTSGKVELRGQEPTSSATGVIALSEMADGSTATRGKYINLLIIGY